MIENGLRGFDNFPETADDGVDDLDTYGIDWEELHSADIMAHHMEHNADQELDPGALENPFSNDGPHKLSHVEVQEPLCPFTPDQVLLLDAHLSLNRHSQSRNMNSRQATVAPQLPDEPDSDPEQSNWSSSRPADFDSQFSQLVDVAQLATDLESGQFSTVPSRSHPSIPDPSEHTPYESPPWLASFVEHMLSRQRVERSEPLTQIILAPAPRPPLRSVTEYLTSRYASELHILRHLTQDVYGTAYIHYTHYRLLSQIASDVGLHINKPRQMAMAGGVYLTYQALFDWAEVHLGTFANVKSTVAQIEQARQQLKERLPNLTHQQSMLLGHLNELGMDPVPGARRSVSLGWSLAELRRNLAPHLSLHPMGPQ
ncbi:hypothetical protein GGX14DRAFT_559247 [Mycena pura]|uniref:Uncharacterized protein n=1 Tax=Mycena pura TaxID=153505 RepID=A0AAD6VR77_9AGAR|nr:hypothetical protein GGX14DRAFT_559247 [Mycena pura]